VSPAQCEQGWHRTARSGGFGCACGHGATLLEANQSGAHGPGGSETACEKGRHTNLPGGRGVDQAATSSTMATTNHHTTEVDHNLVGINIPDKHPFPFASLLCLWTPISVPNHRPKAEWSTPSSCHRMSAPPWRPPATSSGRPSSAALDSIVRPPRPPVVPEMPAISARICCHIQRPSRPGASGGASPDSSMARLQRALSSMMKVDFSPDAAPRPTTALSAAARKLATLRLRGRQGNQTAAAARQGS